MTSGGTEYKCGVCGESGLDLELSGISDNAGLDKGKFDILRCRKCSHRITVPIPSSEDLERYYPEIYYAHSVEGKGVKSRLKWYMKGRLHRDNEKAGLAQSGFGLLGRLLAEPLYIKNGKLLDVGCGVGEYVNFAGNNGWEAWGVEPDDEAVRIGRDSNLNIKQGVAEQLPFENDSFDVIRAWHVIEHTHSPSKAISEMSRVLRSDGHLLISVPNYSSTQRRVLSGCWPHLDVPRHLQHFTPESFKQILSKEGFAKAERLYQGIPFFEIPWRISVCKRQGLDELSAYRLVLKSVVGDLASRVKNDDVGPYMTWWIKRKRLANS